MCVNVYGVCIRATTWPLISSTSSNTMENNTKTEELQKDNFVLIIICVIRFRIIDSDQFWLSKSQRYVKPHRLLLVFSSSSSVRLQCVCLFCVCRVLCYGRVSSHLDWLVIFRTEYLTNVNEVHKSLSYTHYYWAFIYLFIGASVRALVNISKILGQVYIF